MVILQEFFFGGGECNSTLNVFLFQGEDLILYLISTVTEHPG